MTPPESRRERGIAGELQARQYLEARGLHCLDAGWRCRLGELDLVMRDRDVLVFVEVRTRREHNTVDALASIDHGKQRRFVRAARAWLASHPQAAELPARFDIVAIDGAAVRWLSDAFSVHS
ncbi:MAG: YraN family protein [Pseudomonadota bacterium]